MNVSPLTDCLRSNGSLTAKNTIITPFLPLRVFEPYAKIDRSFVEESYSAGFCGGLTIIRCGIGAQNVFNCVEALRGTSCQNIIFIGSCGGIGGSLIGDMLMADINDSPGIKGFGKAFAGFLELGGITFKTAKIYTVESVKDETEALVDNLEKGGFGGIDLETSVFIRAAASNAFSACALLYVTDRPLRRPFTAKFTKEERDKIVFARDAAVKAAVGFTHDKKNT